MNIRVTQASLARAALATIRRAQNDLGVSQEQLATGRRINRLSDAPLDAARAQRLHSHANRLEQCQRNLAHTQNQIEFAASTVQELSDIFTRARELCLRGANTTTEPAERQSLAGAADQLLQELLRGANATLNQRYVFAGTADDAPPFDAEVGSDGLIASVAYCGNAEGIELQVGPRTRLQINEPGAAVFAATAAAPSAFDALIGLRDLLLNKEGLASEEVANALSDHLGQLQQAHERTLDAASRLGWRAAQLEFTRTTLENVGLANAELLSSLEDADFVSAAARLYEQEAAVEAALAISARMLKNSLLEYL